MLLIKVICSTKELFSAKSNLVNNIQKTVATYCFLINVHNKETVKIVLTYQYKNVNYRNIKIQK